MMGSKRSRDGTTPSAPPAVPRSRPATGSSSAARSSAAEMHTNGRGPPRDADIHLDEEDLFGPSGDSAPPPPPPVVAASLPAPPPPPSAPPAVVETAAPPPPAKRSKKAVMYTQAEYQVRVSYRVPHHPWFVKMFEALYELKNEGKNVLLELTNEKARTELGQQLETVEYALNDLTVSVDKSLMSTFMNGLMNIATICINLDTVIAFEAHPTLVNLRTKIAACLFQPVAAEFESLFA